MPDRTDRLRRRQEADRRDHDRTAASDPRTARGDRPRSRHRMERPARRQRACTGTGGRDARAGAQGDEDRVSGIEMTTMADEDRPSPPPSADPLPLAGEGADFDESAYKVSLPSFHGPLDLLLHLIKKNEVDIYDIPILLITDQFSTYLDAMEELDLEVAADYIYMAALLIHIKSKMLLPRDESATAEIEDPRQELVDRLLEYQRFKSVAESFAELDVLRMGMWSRK